MLVVCRRVRGKCDETTTTRREELKDVQSVQSVSHSVRQSVTSQSDSQSSRQVDQVPTCQIVPLEETGV